MGLPEGKFEAEVRAIFADDPEFLQTTDWASFRLHSAGFERFGTEEGPLMQALQAVWDGLFKQVILDPERPVTGPRGRQGRLPSSRVVRRYAERLSRIADLLEGEETKLAQLVGTGGGGARHPRRGIE